MAHIEMLKDVPDGKVAELKKSYEEEGATVVVFSQGGGKSTIIATFPDAPKSETAQTAVDELGASHG